MYDCTWLKQSRQPLWPVTGVCVKWRMEGGGQGGRGSGGVKGRGDKVWLSMLLLLVMVMVIGG